jgi:hypothetical protein
LLFLLTFPYPFLLLILHFLFFLLCFLLPLHTLLILTALVLPSYLPLPTPASNSLVSFFLLCFHLLFHTSHSYSSARPSYIPLPIPASLSSCHLLFPSSFHFRLNSSLYSVYSTFNNPFLPLVLPAFALFYSLPLTLLFLLYCHLPIPTSHFCSFLTSFYTSTNPFQLHVLATPDHFPSFHLPIAASHSHFTYYTVLTPPSHSPPPLLLLSLHLNIFFSCSSFFSCTLFLLTSCCFY